MIIFDSTGLKVLLLLKIKTGSHLLHNFHNLEKEADLLYYPKFLLSKLKNQDYLKKQRFVAHLRTRSRLVGAIYLLCGPKTPFHRTTSRQTTANADAHRVLLDSLTPPAWRGFRNA